MSKKQEKILYGITQIGIIVFLLIFFIKICPLVIFDLDDWYYIGTFRLPLPSWKAHEPTRITPETLLPITGWLAARFVYPICKDYVYAITVVSAIIVTLLISAMCICLHKLLVARCNMTVIRASAFEVLFLIFHFLIFRNRGTSQCMFTAGDLCCIYYYTISGILNAIVVLILFRFENITEKFCSWNFIYKLFFLILLYFALFSNLFHSAMTAIYAGIRLLIGLRYFSHNFKQFIRKNFFYLLILVVWGVVLIFEANGGRADQSGLGRQFDLALSMRQLIVLTLALSKIFAITLFAVAAFMIFYIMKKRTGIKNEIFQMLIMMICNVIVLTIFLLLLNSITAYMSRIDATWGIWFYLITMLTVAIAYISTVTPKVTRFLPVFIMAFMFAAIYPDGKFQMSTREHTDYQTCVQLDQYIIDNIMEAVQSSADEVTIRIPDHSDDLRSLTYNENLGDVVAECLYTHGIITYKPKVYTILDKNLNDTWEIHD